MRQNKSLLFFALFYCAIGVSHASTPFSKYGTIQNVQNYSSSPYWTPNSPYNLRMPTAVYATGPSVETSDCQNLVMTLIETECSARNNCLSTQLSDIRPSLMLQLSRIPNGNYATSCSGYIDTLFDAYLTEHSVAIPSGYTDFPTTITNDSTPELPQVTPPKTTQPTWHQEMQERRQELKDLQSANGITPPHITDADFPTTYADISFNERIKNAADGYAPFQGTSAYKPIEIENESDYQTRHLTDTQNQRQTQYCQHYLTRYQTMKSDLDTLKKCQANNIKFADCTLKGTYN